jgi:hypothetical protein
MRAAVLVISLWSATPAAADNVRAASAQQLLGYRIGSEDVLQVPFGTTRQ